MRACPAAQRDLPQSHRRLPLPMGRPHLCRRSIRHRNRAAARTFRSQRPPLRPCRPPYPRSTVIRGEQLPAKLSLVFYSVDVTLPKLQASLPLGFNVVMVATIAPGKRQHEAIEAVHILRSKGLNIQLTLVGGHNPAYSTHIRELIKKHDLCDAVHILGYSDRALSYLSEADVVLVCSSNEAFGRVTVEAMKLSNQGIGAYAGGTQHLIRAGLTGLL